MPVKCTAFQEHGFSLRNLTFLSEGILPSLYNLVGSEGFCLSSVHHLNVQKVILDLVSHEKILLKIVLSFRRMWLCFPTVACCIVLQMQTWDQDLPHRVTFIIIINATALLFFFFFGVCICRYLWVVPFVESLYREKYVSSALTRLIQHTV